MLPSSPKEALLVCPPSTLWNLPSFIVESALSSPGSRSDTSLSCQGAALAHLDSLYPYDLVLWTDGFVPFPFGKGSSSVLANHSLCGNKSNLSFSAGPVCSSFSTEACAILHPRCWSRQHQLLISFPPIWLSFCPLLHLSFYLNPSGRSGRNCLLFPPVLSGYNWPPDTRFSQGTTRLISCQTGSATCALCNPL